MKNYENISTAAFAERLKLVREEKGLSQEELGKTAGLSKASISKYETGYNAPKLRHAKALADALHVSFNWLIGFSDDRYEIESYRISDIYNKLSDTGKHELYNYATYLLTKELSQKSNEQQSAVFDFPMYGKTAAGPPLGYGDPCYDSVSVVNIPRGAKFALCVCGDSMEPLISDGSIVFVKPQPVAENGEIVIAEVDGAVTCKKYYNQDGNIELRSINQKYLPITQFETIRIIGKVIL